MRFFGRDVISLSFHGYRENIVKWDMAETAKGGPFQEILDGKSFVLFSVYLFQGLTLI